MQDSAEICTVKNSHACKKKTHVAYDLLNILSWSVSVKRTQILRSLSCPILSRQLMYLPLLLMCRTWLIYVFFSPQSLWNSHFLFSLCFDLTQPRTVDLRFPQVTDVRLYVTQQLSIGVFTATLHLRHVERSVFHLTVQDTWLLKMQSFTEVLRN